MKPVSAWLASLVGAAGFFAGARSCNLFEEHNAMTLYAMFVASFVVCYFIAFIWTFRPWRWAIPVILGALAGDRLAIVRDLAKDSTSHNMWPLELGLLAVVISVCALAGAFTGAHISVKARKRATSA